MDFGFGTILLVAIVALAGYAIVIYNGLVRARQVKEEAWSGIDVQLKRRADLIPNLLETVKGYAAHEKTTLDAVIQARNAAVSAQAQGPAAAGPAEGALGAALGRLFALSEADPDLKANQNFLSLQSELSDVENKIAAARRFFNNAVGEFNAAIQAFPAVLFAPQMGFTQREFFDVGEQTRAQIEVAPTVKF